MTTLRDIVFFFSNLLFSITFATLPVAQKILHICLSSGHNFFPLGRILPLLERSLVTSFSSQPVAEKLLFALLLLQVYNVLTWVGLPLAQPGFKW